MQITNLQYYIWIYYQHDILSTITIPVMQKQCYAQKNWGGFM